MPDDRSANTRRCQIIGISRFSIGALCRDIMLKLKFIRKTAVLAAVVLLALTVCGCALINTALSAAAAYGIYQASR